MNNDYANQCVQQTMDNWCRNLGTDDDVEIDGEHSDCNDRMYARFDGTNWRCWDSLSDNVQKACISDNGELFECKSGTGGKCTRHHELSMLIDRGCPGMLYKL